MFDDQRVHALGRPWRSAWEVWKLGKRPTSWSYPASLMPRPWAMAQHVPPVTIEKTMAIHWVPLEMVDFSIFYWSVSHFT